MQSGYLSERKQLESLYKRRKVDVIYSQQPIQPLKSVYSPSEQINIVLQNSKHFVDIGKIQLFFRPIIKYNYSSADLAGAAALSVLGITPVDADNCFFTMQSITANGNQIMANPQTSLLRTRSIWQAYYNNFMSNKEKNHLHKKYSPANYTFGSDAGSQKTAFTEVGIVHPNGSTGVAGSTIQTSKFEGSDLPRAIVSRLSMYNTDMNLPASAATATYISNEYFAQTCTSNGDALLGANVNAGVNNGSVLQAYDAGTNTFPLLPLAVTPSSCVYKGQQERFQLIRQRFLVANVTPYSVPVFTGVGNTYPTAYAAASAGAGQTGFGQTYIVNQGGGGTFAAQQKQVYCMSIQDQSQNGTNRATGILPTAANATYIQNEQFTELSCELRALSCELDQLGLMPMDSTQWVIQLQLNQPQNVLSAYLQSGSFFAPNIAGSNPIGSSANVNLPALSNVQNFLQACQLGQKATYIITDVCCRIEYFTYPDESYAIMRELLRQPKPYQSVRQQIDNIPGSGVFTQRLSIGSSSLINCLILFFVPNQVAVNTQGVVLGANTYGRTQDTVVNLAGCQPPCISDLRATYMDSYYMTMSSVYAEVDGRRYESMDIPISNPELSTYLKTQSGLQTALGKYIDVDLQEYLLNRFFYVIPINPHNDTQMMVHDQQIVITLNINADSRVQSSTLWNETNKSINNRFSLLTFAVTHQALVDASYVKVL